MHAVPRELDIRVSPLWPSLVGASIRCILAERKIRSTFSLGTPSPPPSPAKLRYRKFNSRVNRGEFIARPKERDRVGLSSSPMNTETPSLSLSLAVVPRRIRFLDNTFRRCSSSNVFASYISSVLFPAARRKSGGYPFFHPDFPK